MLIKFGVIDNRLQSYCLEVECSKNPELFPTHFFTFYVAIILPACGSGVKPISKLLLEAKELNSNSFEFGTTWL